MKAFDIALERLEKHCPLAKPYLIETVSVKDRVNHTGLFKYRKGQFIIEIAADVSKGERIDILIHEWAHGLRKIIAPQGFHDDLFGIEWARCHRAVYSDTSDDDDIMASQHISVSAITFPEIEEFNVPLLRVER